MIGPLAPEPALAPGGEGRGVGGQGGFNGALSLLLTFPHSSRRVSLMTFWLLTVVAFGAWTALLVVLYQISRGVAGAVGVVSEVAESLRNPDLGRLEGDVDALKLQVESLPSIWDDHEQRIKRATDRQRAYARIAAQRSEEQLESSPGDVQQDDGSGGAFNGMQSMPQAVAQAQPEPQLDYIAAGWRRKLNG